MKKINKVLSLKIITITLSISFLLSNTLNAYPIPKDTLRVPLDSSGYRKMQKALYSADNKNRKIKRVTANVNNAQHRKKGNRQSKELIGRAKRSAKESMDWARMRDDWRLQYQAARKKIVETQGLDSKLAIIREIHGQMSQKEILRIKAIEQAEAKAKGPSPYPIISPRKTPWNHELDVEVEPQWDESDVGKYYYHGTSLGIAIVSKILGFLGGIKGLSEEMDIDNVMGDRPWTYFTSTKFHREEKRPSLGGVVEECSVYANRTSRPARAVLAYWAFRAVWEAEGRQERFPPFEYFLQRAILQVPKKDTRRVSGEAFVAQLSTDKPTPLHNARMLLDKDIPFPKASVVTDFGSLAYEDPENLGMISEGFRTLSSDEQSRIENLDLYDYNNEPWSYYLESLGNEVMDRWRPMSDLLYNAREKLGPFLGRKNIESAL